MANLKNLTKTQIAQLSWIITFAAFLSFSLSACEKSTNEEIKVSGEVTSDVNGKITFIYSRTNASRPESCLFTTSLPTPNDQFTITIASGNSSGEKIIDGLTAGQKVKWTATVKGKPLNHGSTNFVHIINN